MRGSFPRSIAASLMVVYSAGVGVVPKVRRMQRNPGFSKIGMHVDAIFCLRGRVGIQHQGLFFLS